MATLGTSSSHPDVIAEMYDAGTDIFRLDFSHGSPAAHGERHRTIRALETGLSRPAAILADLQGTRFRLGLIVGGFVSLCAGQSLRLDLDASPGNSRRIPLPQPEFFAQVRAGDELFIDDGRVRLLVMSAANDHAETIVLAGGYVADAKRVAIPACAWPGALTEKDRTDAVYAAAMGVEWLALPAACGVEGFAEIRNLVGTRPRLIARLDNSAALAHIDDTLAAADGIMFARHDLAMSLPWNEIASLQRKLFMACVTAGKMMVAATQKLTECGHGTMHPNAALEDTAATLHCGAHVLMLSAGSAFGTFPVENVAMVERFIRTAECGIYPEDIRGTWSAQTEMPIDDTMQVTPQPQSALQSPLHSPAAGNRLPRIEMRKRSGDLYTPDDSHMTAPR